MDRKRGLVWLALFIIAAVGFAFRVPGVLWLIEATPSVNYSVHPDVQRFIAVAQNFEGRPAIGGYVIGMASHLYLINKLLITFFSAKLDLAILIRLISVTYGVFTIILIYFIARSWGFQNKVALLSSALLAVSPLHVYNSHFGTPDASAAFYFYLALYAGWGYAKSRHQFLFVLFAALIGANLAMKFFIPLFVPLFLVILFHTKDDKVEKIMTSFLIVIVSFLLFSLFSYTPWHFKELIKMLAFDNVQIIGEHNATEQIGLYLWDTVSALGLANWDFLLIGLVLLITDGARNAIKKAGVNRWQIIIEKITKSPGLIFFSAFIVYGILLIFSDIHAVRHLLVFVPVACLVSASGFWKLFQCLRHTNVIAGITLSLLITYQCYSVINLNKMYSGDIRNAMAEWVKENVREEDNVGTLSRYSRIKGVQIIRNNEGNESELNVDYFVTCDIEYNRYFKNNDATKIFHAFGGQERLNFYRDLFSGKLKYEIVADFKRSPVGIEQYLVEKGVMRGLHTFTPERCLIFRRFEREAVPQNRTIL